MNRFHYLLTLFLFVLAASCRSEVDSAAFQVYDGPVNMATNVHVVHSDSAIVRSEIRAPKQLEFAEGDLEFPDGIEIEFFEIDGTLSTTMRADRGYFDKKDNLYRGEGNVQVRNLLEDQRLQAEELFWNPNEKRIYTETFVTIQDKQTLFNGTGMEADESFTNYTLKQVRDSKTLLPGEGL
ncbi:LPS export ABC transporter periplasmic protein LptC [Algoriphagus sp. CAU 1675]|uniref:LPS export ABC transporter periplasmic protein LptC n=1 Tax=Algoriphagus sp. CAU 1675 TaxID=3032597 RepID=UPI0023D9C75B|nr:LPS export ABC transporter periplasmic protein LptC [Algoriphagus sp. CAU 1675]MDF2156309.1 LPS export ABC transporter periplasmic protein LptC [Algoriphagus sp. CAU 1675]